MRLSTRGRYAVMAMVELAARQPPDGLEDSRARVSLAEIAQAQHLSLAYLEQLFGPLRRAGLVASARGPGGGYRLARAASATSIAEIVLAVDEPLRATRCGDKSPGCMMNGERCLTHDLWEETGRQIEAWLASVSLEDVVTGRVGPGRRAA